jgi:hypothetical protein
MNICKNNNKTGREAVIWTDLTQSIIHWRVSAMVIMNSHFIHIPSLFIY